MTKKLSIAAALLLGMSGAAHAATDGDWKLYPTYDNYFNQVVDTQSRTFVVALSQYYNASNTQFSSFMGNLFVYDKDGDEYKAYTLRDKLSEVTVSKIAYNEKSKYLLVVYDNGNIDLLYDNGKVKNIPGLKTFTLKTSKAVNDIVFCPQYNEVYLATAFGYVVIDDNKCVITTSRNFNTSVTTMARVGNYLYLVAGGTCYKSGVNNPNLSLDSFESGVNSNLAKATNLLPLNSETAFAAVTSAGTCVYATMNEDGSIKSATTKSLNAVSRLQRSSQGYVTYSTSQYALIPYDYDGTQSLNILSVPSALSKTYASSWNYKEFWGASAREGLTSLKYENSSWTVTREPMRPNAPACFMSYINNMTYSPTYGVIASNHGVSDEYSDTSYGYGINLLSGVKDGVWSVYAPIYTNPAADKTMYLPNGCTVDIDNDKYVYQTGFYSGITRFNLEDPTDILHMTHPSDATAALDSYYKLDVDDSWAAYFNLSAPKFDGKGNLWAMRHLYGAAPTNAALYVWPSDKRKASDPTGWIRLNILPEVSIAKCVRVLPLKADVNKNLLVLYDGKYGGKLYVYDTNGTLEDTSDDRIALLNQIYDEDGNSITREYIYAMYEDTSTGNVWIGHSSGLFLFTPSGTFADPMTVKRIKISRNDGTTVADYLLDGVPVMNITADNSGNKWFATRGGGLVETNSSGTEVLRQLLSSNSYLPEDNVLDLCYNPSSNSVVVSTLKGYAEYFIPGSSTGVDFDSVKVYPNPVRPDYTGWVTIEGLLDNALIKIVDGQGSLVKELGSASGGVIQWDGTNLNNTKVNSGVYYVCMSSATDGVSEANVAKILVVK